MSDGYAVTKTRVGCYGCEKAFQPGEVYFSLLFEEGDTFSRRDFCKKCWDSADKENGFSFWKTRCPKETGPPRIETEAVLEFFEKLENSNSPNRQEMRFVLALFLARRKTLKFKSVESDQKNGEEVLVFRRTGTDETVRIPDPGLTEEQIEATTEKLKELFYDPVM
ncbi:MAG: hypothetical protein ACLFWL_02850 [Candidatus Brocadiia bacterium]